MPQATNFCLCELEKLTFSYKLNALTPKAICQKRIFGHFGDFQPGYGRISSNLLQKTLATWQHAFLSTSTVLYNIFAQACAEIKTWRPTTRFSIYLLIFLSHLFAPFAIFLWQWLTFYWAYFQFKNCWESILETGNFYHEVAICKYSGRKFCCKFFTQMSEYFWEHITLHGADHSDLSIIGNIFSSYKLEYRWCQFFGQRWWCQKWNKA